MPTAITWWEPIRGDRAINEAQAEVVRRVFRDYAAGKSAKTIVFALNRDGIPAPSGGDWGFSTINGNGTRGKRNTQRYVCQQAGLKRPTLHRP
ncbi:recombinase family protein [Rhizobium rhizogenes]|uniref:recombinase family protein n=1 Tax=Rhizobium rhizogenes TaxID=359 RepID=UPI00286995DD|nr:recombinase family protein [Rhizobium rhizogenes]